LIREVEYRGVWWLPEDPDRKIGGIFKFSPSEGVQLELAGALKGSVNLSKPFTPELILGKIPEKGRVTLYRCLEVHRLVSAGESSDIIAEIAFLGAHIDPRHTTFSSMTTEAVGLDLWANINWVEFPEPRELFSKNFSMRFHRPDPLEAQLSDGTKVVLGVRLEGLKKSWVQTEVRLRRNTFAKVNPPSPRPFEESLELLQAMLDLASLGILHSVAPSLIKGTIEESEDERNEVEILYQVSNQLPIDVSALNLYATLFTLADVYDHFQDVIRNWFDVRDRLKPVLTLYFATIRAPRMYVESHFLNVVHALEAFHRLVIGGHDLPEDEYQKRVDEIIDSAPYQWREWLMKKLEHSNEPSLRTRLTEICRMFPHVSSRLIGNRKERKHFISQVVDTRNYLTHHDPKLEKRAAQGIALFYLTEKLKVLVECCLLRELGFSNEWILERIGRARLDRMPKVR